MRSTLLGMCFRLLILFLAYSEANAKIKSTIKEQSLTSRPIWSHRHNNSWICGNTLHGAVQCGDSSLLGISRCYCMYYSSATNKTVFGTCFYTCFNPQHTAYFKINRYSVSNYSDFNEDMCNPVSRKNNIKLLSHRVGRFCGKCQQNFGLAVYSYHLSSCIPCSQYKHINWLKYVAIALGPLTAFYFIVVIFGVNLAAGKMSGLIFSVQLLMSPLNLIQIDSWYHSNTIEGSTFFKVLASIFGPINLDFFRDVYPKFCISPSFSILHILALDYIVALYPFFLISLTYILIKMYDKNCYVVVVAWKPLKCLLSKKHFNKRTTLVETFCTFMLLSSIKIVAITTCLLSKARIYDESGKRNRKNFLYLDATIRYFGHEHHYFGILAVLTCFIFVFFPFLLLLSYPCKCFQKLMNAFGGIFQPLHVFMDVLQGSYKTSPIDLRYFSAYYHFLRFLCQFITAYFQSVSILPFTAVVLMVSSLVFAAVQPYKNQAHNRLDLTCLLFITTFYSSATLMLFMYYLDIIWIEVADFAFMSALFAIALFYVVMLLYAMFGHNIRTIYNCVYSKRKKREENFEEHNEIYSSDETRSLLTYSTIHSEY